MLRMNVKNISGSHVGFMTAVLAAVVLLGGYGHGGGSPSELATALLAAAVAGAAAGFLWVRRWYAWFAGVALGLFGGLVSALQLFEGESFSREFFVALVTFLFFLLLGFLLGAIAEFIRLLHHIAHDRRKW